MEKRLTLEEINELRKAAKTLGFSFVMEDLLDSLFSDLTATGSQILNFGITWAVIILAFIAFGFLLLHIRSLRDDCKCG